VLGLSWGWRPWLQGQQVEDVEGLAKDVHYFLPPELPILEMPLKLRMMMGCLQKQVVLNQPGPGLVMGKVSGWKSRGK
jgi:hypothetical protein